MCKLMHFLWGVYKENVLAFKSSKKDSNRMKVKPKLIKQDNEIQTARQNGQNNYPSSNI